MNRIAATIAAAALTLSLSSCTFDNSPAEPDTSSFGYYHTVDVNMHGRVIPCVTWKEGYAGGLSCDWSK